MDVLPESTKGRVLLLALLVTTMSCALWIVAGVAGPTHRAPDVPGVSPVADMSGGAEQVL